MKNSDLCVLCLISQDPEDLNVYGECRECLDAADHLISEGWE